MRGMLAFLTMAAFAAVLMIGACAPSIDSQRHWDQMGKDPVVVRPAVDPATAGVPKGDAAAPVGESIRMQKVREQKRDEEAARAKYNFADSPRGRLVEEQRREEAMK